MCTHVDGLTVGCHRGWYFKGKASWSPQGKLNNCIPNMPCFAAQFTEGGPCTRLSFSFWGGLDRFRVCSDWNCIQVVTRMLALYCTSLLQLVNICSRPAPPQRAPHKGNLQYYFSLFTRHHLWLMGVTGVELSTNQLSAHIGVLFSARVSARGKEWTLWGLNQAVISRTDCLFFHYLCPSDKQAWVLTYDPFH